MKNITGRHGSMLIVITKCDDVDKSERKDYGHGEGDYCIIVTNLCTGENVYTLFYHACPTLKQVQYVIDN